MLGSNAVPIQVPIGAEETFVGVVDLVTTAMIWHSEDLGFNMTLVDIPADTLADATEWREKLPGESCG